MKVRSVLIKPASSLCNMSCRYCFYADVSCQREQYSYGIMKEDVMKVLIEKALLGVDQVHFIFQGGEPTLAGYDYFQSFIDYVRQCCQPHQKVAYFLQTNGYRLDERFYSLFQKEKFLIGVSLDGYEMIHNKYRPALSKGTFHEVMKTIAKLKEYHIEFNILTVLTKELSKHASQLYQFYKRNHFTHVQLIPCLPELNHNPQDDAYALLPKQFASFYNQLFRLWYKDYLKGKAISIYLFDNVIPMFNGIPPQMCGMLGQCQVQFVVEANGNIYPCDFYCTDDYCIGHILKNDFQEMAKNYVAMKFLQEPKRESELCDTCRMKNMCHGNCKRLNVAYFDDKGYCGYRDFLETNFKEFQEIAKYIRG